jgi:hypothetical protein
MYKHSQIPSEVPLEIPPPSEEDNIAFNEEDDAELEKCINDVEKFDKKNEENMNKIYENLIKTDRDKYNENQSEIYENFTKDSKKNVMDHATEAFEKMKHSFFNLPKNRKIQTYSFFEYRFILQIIMTLVICNEKLNEEPFNSNKTFMDYVKEILVKQDGSSTLKNGFNSLYISYISCIIYSSLIEKKNIQINNFFYTDVSTNNSIEITEYKLIKFNDILIKFNDIEFFVTNLKYLTDIIDYVNLMVTLGNINCIDALDKIKTWFKYSEDAKSMYSLIEEKMNDITSEFNPTPCP